VLLLLLLLWGPLSVLQVSRKALMLAASCAVGCVGGTRHVCSCDAQQRRAQLL
jgi:hypothetical protein